MCVICDRIGMQVIGINFEWERIPKTERDLIEQAIEDAYDTIGVVPYVMDSGAITRCRCVAYEEDGEPAIVHAGHCTGAFGGSACPYYNQKHRTYEERCRYGRRGDNI